jgi:nucleoside-diphosphate-sugar epimerase
MNILVTGVCGLIGKKLAIYLLGKGYKVFGIGRSKCDDLDDQPLFNFFSIDLASHNASEELKKAILVKIDLIIHCAAQQPRPGLLFKDYRKGNIDTTENIVEWAKDSNIQTIISFSTVAFLDFSQENGATITESARVNPSNNYALSKMISESYLKISANDYNLTILCFRIPSLVHEDQQDGLIHTYWNSAMLNIDLDIYDNGQFRRNLVYIDSILEVVDIVLTKLVNFKGFKLYNIGSKDAWTLLEIAEYIYKRMRATAKIFPIDKSSTVRGHWDIDVSKAEDELDFTPWSTQKVLDIYLQNMREDGK